MDLNHEFTVNVPVAEAWAILTDLERIAPCLPGAQLTEVEGDTYRGQVKIKVCLLYTSPSPRDRTRSRMPSSA